jgi:hypothetical protein
MKACVPGKRVNDVDHVGDHGGQHLHLTVPEQGHHLHLRQAELPACKKNISIWLCMCVSVCHLIETEGVKEGRGRSVTMYV